MEIVVVIVALLVGWASWSLALAHRKLNALGRAAGIRFHPLTGQQVGTESHRDG